MALHPFITRGIVYDTEKQTARLYQAVNRLAVSNTTGELYVVIDVFRTAQGEYCYTLIGMTTLTVCTTKFIFDTAEAEDFGFYADCSAPVVLPKNLVNRLIARASDMAFDPEEELPPMMVCEESEQLLDKAYLSPKARIVEYSDKCYAVFTAEEHDAELLQFIGATKNDRLTWQGKKVSGWVVPKSRRERLARLVK